MKLVISALDGDVETFRETFENLSVNWKTLRYTLKDGISLTLKELKKNENGDKQPETGDNFSLTLTFLQIVVFARKKGLEVFLELLDQDIEMDDWLDAVEIGTKYRNIKIIIKVKPMPFSAKMIFNHKIIYSEHFRITF